MAHRGLSRPPIACKAGRVRNCTYVGKAYSAHIRTRYVPEVRCKSLSRREKSSLCGHTCCPFPTGGGCNSRLLRQALLLKRKQDRRKADVSRIAHGRDIRLA